MLTKIVMDGAATFKKQSAIDISKKVNLVYGLNGTGKSTICKFLRNGTDPSFSACKLQKSGDVDVLVFNDEFIEENFYLSDTIPGIFSLSKENKEAEEKIENLTVSISANETERSERQAAHQSKLSILERELDAIVDKLFDIKRENAGGDRVLEYCLEGVMGKKDKLAEKLIGYLKPSQKPSDTVERLQAEARLLNKSDGATPEQTLPRCEVLLHDEEEEPALGVAIVGSKNSNFARFIDELRISDWVKRGVEIVGKKSGLPTTCPFCQEESIDDQVLAELTAYFDKSFEDQVATVLRIKASYEAAFDEFKRKHPLKEGLFFDEKIRLLESRLEAELEANLLLIRSKVENPSSVVEMKRTGGTVKELNAVIGQVNEKIAEHNEKMANLGPAKKDISRRFWELMRWTYDQSIGFHDGLKEQIRELNFSYEQEKNSSEQTLLKLKSELAETQKSTVNIDEAIARINSELVNIGIVDFRIEKYNDALYRLERPGGRSGGFKTLSEGEKMVIALLYFCELFAGKISPTEVSLAKVAVFDDPVSSLSHIYVFNIGRLLHHKFFRGSLAKQIFVFTHSLYFFYELTDTNHKRREESQSLFRVIKNSDGSAMVPMSYEEIQNDYQSYWKIINDNGQHPALIANCMRNIIEYFFGFVEKKDFNNVFQKPALQHNKFQSFCRYMNRESHSMGQNVFDIKEFDYAVFKEGLGCIFHETGYSEHYKQMTSA